MGWVKRHLAITIILVILVLGFIIFFGLPILVPHPTPLPQLLQNLQNQTSSGQSDNCYPTSAGTATTSTMVTISGTTYRLATFNELKLRAAACPKTSIKNDFVAATGTVAGISEGGQALLVSTNEGQLIFSEPGLDNTGAPNPKFSSSKFPIGTKVLVGGSEYFLWNSASTSPLMLITDTTPPAVQVEP